MTQLVDVVVRDVLFFVRHCSQVELNYVVFTKIISQFPEKRVEEKVKREDLTKYL